MKFGLIGAGNMGYPMLAGAVKTFGAENVVFSCLGEAEAQRAAQTGAVRMADNRELASLCDMIVLVIKPYVYETVLEEIKDVIRPNTIVITVAAGITMDFVKKALLDKPRMVRVMPNTPAMVGEGMSAVTYTPNVFSAEEKKQLDAFFDSFGSFVELPESLQDAAIPASGSSSAFVYVFIEAMADAAVACGIPRDTAYKMTAQTVLGAAKMVLETKEHPGRLKDNVCTPGGTTIAGVRKLEEMGFRSAVMEACIATFDKVKSMKK
mgnify:CR=1 FL=1